VLRGGPVVVTSTVVPIQTEGSRPPIFCAQPIGGDVQCYQPLSRAMGSAQPFYGLGSQHWTGGTDIDQDTIEQLAALYVRDLRTFHSSGPYFLGGWSSGGVVAYEIARQLAAAGQDVGLLALFDSMLAADSSEMTEAELLISDVENRAQQTLNIASDDVLQLPIDEQYSYIRDCAIRIGVLSDDIEVEQLQMYVRRQRHVRRLRSSYRPERFHGRITLFRAALNSGRDDRSSTSESVLRQWSELTPFELDVHSVPGNHQNMLREPCVTSIACALESCIPELTAANGRP
jgi:thioesterase domain-containing protein